MSTSNTPNSTPNPSDPSTPTTRKLRRDRKLLWGIIPLTGLLAFLASCAEVATPFRGPRYDPSSRTLMPIESAEADGDRTYILALTNATLDRSRRGIFDDYTRELEKALPDTPGLVGFSIRARPLGSEVWTMTLWTSDEAADDFVGSPLHRKAIREAMPAVITSRFYRGPWTSTMPPTWAEAKALLESAPVNNYRSAAPASESPTAPAETHR